MIEAVEFANGTYEPPRRRPRERAPSPEVDLDLADVRGQALARRALEIAAVGGHNILLIGPPGSGKTMLARRLPGILPPLTDEESLEVTRVWSVAGLLEPQELPIRRRPFRAPHHHASAASIVGGGSGTLTPGEVSLAHRGVLFMDELPLFSRHVLEALRQPLEDGSVTVARRDARVRFPARFALVGAANPCLCEAGAGSNGCLCTGSRLERYRSRLSGPLLDRIDLHVEVARLTPDEMMDLDQAESTGAVACRVSSAIDFRILRSSESGETSRPTDLGVRRFLGDAIRGEMMTARGYARTLRVARTIADLALSSDLEVDHVAEAMQFRQALWSRI